MPIYAYRCESCGHAKDVLQKLSDPQLTVCPACGADAFRKQVTAAGFQLKGSGWYVTDFKGGAAPVPPVKSDDAAAAKPADADKAAPAPADKAASPAGASAAPAVAPPAPPAAAPAAAAKPSSQGGQ
jgi:putative FmdB family regulatory protein